MASRPLSDWASLIEIIAGVAVVISLVYVAYEVRQNTIAMEASTRQEFAAHDIAFLSTILDPGVLAVAQAKYESGQALTDLEFSQLKHRQHLNFRIFENAHYQWQKGTLEEAEWLRYRNIVRSVMCREKPAQSMWAQFQLGFQEPFRAEVNALAGSCEESA